MARPNWDNTQPRVPAGIDDTGGEWRGPNWASAPNMDSPRPRVLRDVDDEKLAKSATFQNAVQAGVDAVPAEDAAAVAHVRIYLNEMIDDIAPGKTQSGTLGHYQYSHGQGIAKTITIGRKLASYYNHKLVGSGMNNDPTGVVVHEIGHAVDHAAMWRLSREFENDIKADVGRMKYSEMKKAAYFIEDRKEGFAELYKTAYSPNRKAKVWGNMKRERAEVVFERSLTRLKGR